MEIKKSRDKIDTLDREIVKLLVERMNLSAEIASYKKANAIPLFDKTREEDLLEKIVSLSGDVSDYTQKIYLEILKQSKAYQEKITNKN